jgi:3'-phosphoadenosine 5'-phosphosulfate (PAPS) 3'-phosphatase
MAEFLQAKRLASLCKVTTRACTVLGPMVVAFYSSITGETAKMKADASIFTIADGIVQNLLIDHLFAGSKFAAVVGEEEGSLINISSAPYLVDDLVVPVDFYSIIDEAKVAMDDLAGEIHASAYHDLTIFIDPIDGTREFSTGKGEQCSICVGFSDKVGKPVAGVVYRPITQPPTYAAGAASESFAESVLDMAAERNDKGFLTSNGSISPFIAALITAMGFDRVPSGGVGNKMLMLLEGKGAAYIQDRGVSRWDTSGAQAVLEANGGILNKLTRFVDSNELQSYTYLKAALNLDFEPGMATLTPYNSADKGAVKKGDAPRKGSVEEFAAYSNLCGLLALSSAGLPMLSDIQTAVQSAKVNTPPAYD